MNRLVAAILILFAVLAGLRFANSSLFQRNVANQIDSPASATRSTGFSTDSTGTSSSAQVAAQSASTPSSQVSTTGAATGDTTALPPSQQTAVPAGW